MEQTRGGTHCVESKMDIVTGVLAPFPPDEARVMKPKLDLKRNERELQAKDHRNSQGFLGS